MTYRELLAELSKFNDEQLDCDLTVEFSQIEEFYPACLGFTGDEPDVLDPHHPVIRVND